MKRKRLHILILCSLFSYIGKVPAWAEQVIIVSYFNHIEFQEALASIGRLEVCGDDLYLVDKGGQRMGSARIESGMKLKFGDVDESLLGINNAAHATQRLLFSIDGDYVCIDGLQQPTVVRVFGIDGGLVMSDTIYPESEVKLSLATLSNGIYILQINTCIFKIQKK